MARPASAAIDAKRVIVRSRFISIAVRPFKRRRGAKVPDAVGGNRGGIRRTTLELSLPKRVVTGMNFLVTVDDRLAPSFLELMKNIQRVKIERISPEKNRLMREIKQSIEEVKSAELGATTLRPARELLREL